MSVHQGEVMDTDDMDDAESKYFQEVGNYDDSADQSSGSFQGSVSIPTFTTGLSNLQASEGFQAMEQANFNVALSALALQGSQGFQTLDQYAEGHGRELTFDSGQTWQNPGFQSANIVYMSSNALTRSNSCNSGAQLSDLSGKPKSTELEINQVKNMNVVETCFEKVSNSDSQKVLPVFLDENRTGSENSARCMGQQLPLTVDSQFQEPDIMQTVSNVSTADGTSQETRSPKRRQRKSRSSSHQATELATQKSESGQPSVSPNRVEHGSAEGQTGTELGFKPSLLEEILTEKKLALLRSPEVIQFLQSEQAQQAREKNIMYGQHTDKS